MRLAMTSVTFYAWRTSLHFTSIFLFMMCCMSLSVCHTPVMQPLYVPRTSNHLVAAVHMKDNSARNVQFCPEFCHCSKVNTNLTVQSCTQNPADELSLLLRNSLDISVLIIFESSLSKLSSAVCNMTNLKSLNVSKNKLSTLPWGCLKKLKYLQTIIASENRIRQLDNGSFYDFPALQNLELQSNELSFIDVDVFMQVERIKYLQKIDLSSNQLISVDPWPIMFIHKPAKINFAGNYISMFTNRFNFTFERKYFKTHKTINFAYNRITHISNILLFWSITLSFVTALTTPYTL